jgi:hypothetical protein
MQFNYILVRVPCVKRSVRPTRKGIRDWEWGRDGTHCGAPGVGQVSVTVPGPDVAGGLTGQQVRLLVV